MAYADTTLDQTHSASGNGDLTDRSIMSSVTSSGEPHRRTTPCSNIQAESRVENISHYCSIGSGGEADPTTTSDASDMMERPIFDDMNSRFMKQCSRASAEGYPNPQIAAHGSNEPTASGGRHCNRESTTDYHRSLQCTSQNSSMTDSEPLSDEESMSTEGDVTEGLTSDAEEATETELDGQTYHEGHTDGGDVTDFELLGRMADEDQEDEEEEQDQEEEEEQDQEEEEQDQEEEEQDQEEEEQDQEEEEEEEQDQEKERDRDQEDEEEEEEQDQDKEDEEEQDQEEDEEEVREKKGKEGEETENQTGGHLLSKDRTRSNAEDITICREVVTGSSRKGSTNSNVALAGPVVGSGTTKGAIEIVGVGTPSSAHLAKEPTTLTTLVQPTYYSAFSSAPIASLNGAGSITPPTSCPVAAVMNQGSVLTTPFPVLSGHHVDIPTYPIMSSAGETSRILPGSSLAPPSARLPITGITPAAMAATQHRVPSLQKVPAVVSHHSTPLPQRGMMPSHLGPYIQSNSLIHPYSSPASMGTILTKTRQFPTTSNGVSIGSSTTIQPPASNMVTTTTTMGCPSGSITRLQGGATFPVRSCFDSSLSTGIAPVTVLTSSPLGLEAAYPRVVTQYTADQIATNISHELPTSQQSFKALGQRGQSQESLGSQSASRASCPVATKSMGPPIVSTTTIGHTTPVDSLGSKRNEGISTSVPSGTMTTPHLIYTSVVPRRISTTSGVSHTTVSYSAPANNNTMPIIVQPSEASHLVHQAPLTVPFTTDVSIDCQQASAPYTAYQLIGPTVAPSINHSSLIERQNTASELMEELPVEDEVKSLRKHEKIAKKTKCSCTC